MAIFASLLAARNRIGRKDETESQEDVNCNYCDETPGTSPYVSPNKNMPFPPFAGAGCQQAVINQNGVLLDCHTRNLSSQQTADKFFQHDEVSAVSGGSNGNSAFVRSRSINEWVILDMKVSANEMNTL